MIGRYIRNTHRSADRIRLHPIRRQRPAVAFHPWRVAATPPAHPLEAPA